MLRAQLVKSILDNVPREETKTKQDAITWWTENWASNVFTDEVVEKLVPKNVYKAFKHCVRHHQPLDPTVADVIANALKDWALEKGATHYTHWFQPIHIATAEKHEAFITYTGNGKTILKLSGSELIRGEPDASSFPNGGIRSTSQARGYTTWDPSSPAFIRTGTNGSTLIIPTCFVSWTGDALDVKTPLLRATASLSAQCVRLLKLLGDDKVESVNSTLGAEQEFFVVDRAFYTARPDLLFAGRTIVGAKPPKGQEMEDHYFATIPPRILAYIQEVEKELWKLGIPTRARHNEVAPGQHEMAPIFEFSNLAADHNMVMMDVMREVAQRHGLAAILHEKPFAGVNGSGKHNNWSMATDYGLNLLEPTKNPRENLVFQCFLAATLQAVDVHADLLRAAIAVPGNDFRLGANEAPPAIISAYLGAEIDDLVQWLMNDHSDSPASQVQVKKPSTLHLGKGVAPFKRDKTDRNRTSPFAFTGNKFEFRAVGSSQSVGHIVTILNTCVTDAVKDFADKLEVALKKEGATLKSATSQLLKETLTRHKRIIFNGNGYSQEWVEEASKRGLANHRECVVALSQYASQKNIDLFKNYSVLSPDEVTARRNIYFNHYCHQINVEGQVAVNMANTLVLPAALTHQKKVADSVKAAKDAGLNVGPQADSLKEATDHINSLIVATKDLQKAVQQAHSHHDDGQKAAEFYRDNVKPAIAKVRTHVDALEEIVESDLWPYPRYSDMLFIK